MDIQIGDRVTFKKRGLPGHTFETPEGRDNQSWSERFGGLAGVVDVLDPTNREIRVRGLDADGTAFTVWIDPKHLDVTDAAPVERG
jgi:hypothetical protein